MTDHSGVRRVATKPEDGEEDDSVYAEEDENLSD